jgi:hypothetical protein
MRSMVAAVVALVIAGLLLVVVGTTAPPLARTCAANLSEAACESAVNAVLRRGLPPLHPLILGAHAEPGAAPGSDQFGHRATVAFDLLGVPGPTSVELFFDEGAHWGGEADRSGAEMAAWAVAPLLVAIIGAAVVLGLAWRRRPKVTA